jgi:hypothetical protein
MARGRRPEEPQSHTTPIRGTDTSSTFPAGSEEGRTASARRALQPAPCGSFALRAVSHRSAEAMTAAAMQAGPASLSGSDENSEYARCEGPCRTWTASVVEPVGGSSPAAPRGGDIHALLASGGLAAASAWGATNRAAFPDPPSDALRASAGFAIKGAGHATKGVGFPDPPSSVPVPTTQADGDDNKDHVDVRGSADDRGRRESSAVSSHPRAHQADHRSNRLARHARPRQNPQVRFPERTRPRNNRQVRHPQPVTGTKRSAEEPANPPRSGRPSGARLRASTSLRLWRTGRRLPSSASRSGADGPNKTNPPCRKFLATPRVVTRMPENRKPRSNPRPWQASHGRRARHGGRLWPWCTRVTLDEWRT